jgi:hypothetical protein
MLSSDVHPAEEPVVSPTHTSSPYSAALLRERRAKAEIRARHAPDMVAALSRKPFSCSSAQSSRPSGNDEAIPVSFVWRNTPIRLSNRNMVSNNWSRN